jgi:CitMHS family citrate-Mg2+:H+ or citrate-Ca2+:H+ symporter
LIGAWSIRKELGEERGMQALLDVITIGVLLLQAALLGQMTTGFPVSPLTPATFLVVGLTGIDLADHQKFSIPILFGASLVMTIACVILGIFTL